MTDKREQYITALKAEVTKILHSITDCQQTVWGYFELGEFHKAYIISLDCRSKYATLAARLADLDNLQQQP